MELATTEVEADDKNRKLKYYKELSELGCEMNDYKERDGRKCCCWAFDPIEHNDNFVPRAIAVPDQEITCTRYALSFFDTTDKGRKRMLRMEMKTAKIRVKLGTHLATGVLNKTDGVSGESNKNGHFNHFEYVGVDVRKNFAIAEPI